jgi:cysteine desulfurase
MKKLCVYLDYAATTPVDKQVLKKMLPFFSIDFGNASSLHHFGETAKDAVDQSRKEVALSLGVLPEEVVFTSGATESNNLALKGIFKTLSALPKYKNKKIHFIVSSIEHACVLDSAKALAGEFPETIEVTYLNPNQEGLVELEAVKKAIRPNTALVSLMYVNNEIGTVQPIKEVGKFLNEVKKKRKVNDLPLYFHSDATQAFSYFSCNLSSLGLDLLTFSAHKIYGPKGVGALAIKKGVMLSAIQHGGGHEFKKRSGTLNVPGIVGLGETTRIAEKERKMNVKKVLALRSYLAFKIEKEIPQVVLNGSLKERTPNNLNYSFSGIEGESLVLLLSQRGIGVSTGSACSSQTLKASHVQLAIGNDHLRAHSSIRFTLGKYLKKSDLDYAVKELKIAVEKLRAISKGIKV